jgi:DNA invertase Pin-like site-specific DNA recombinase
VTQSNQRALHAPMFAAGGSHVTAAETTSDPSVQALGYLYVRAPARLTDTQVRRQGEAIGEFCRRKGWDLVALLRDIEIGPKRGPGQPALINVIERLRTGQASCLVVAEVRQLCSSVAELGGILVAVEHAGARFVSLDPAFDTGTPVGRAIGRMLTSVSGWERARRAEMTSAARSKAAAAHAVPSDLRRRIVRMRSADMTLQAIADQLNDEGVPTMRGGARWRPSSVQATLGYKRPPRLTDVSENEAPQRDEWS